MDRTLIDGMTIFEQARWYSLIECINMVADECEKRKKKFKKMRISPIDIKDYIESTCDIYASKIKKEVEDNKEKDISLNLYNLSIKVGVPSIQEVTV